MSSLSINVLLLVLALALLLSTKPHEATRVLHEEEEERMMKKESSFLLFQSLQTHTPITPSGPNPSTNIPSPVPFSKNFAGHAMPPPPPSPVYKSH